MAIDWLPSKEYQEYAERMRGEREMSEAYRCDKCGEFHEGDGTNIKWAAGFSWSTGQIDLCPVCAPTLVEELEKIASRVNHSLVHQTGALPINGCDPASDQ